MAEKRKLSVRDRREPSAKRRASEVAPQGSSKRKASTPNVAPTPPPALSATPVPVEKPLPTKIKDGEALPTLSAPQPAELPDTEYQSIAESAVLLASLERSKKKWLSDGILERYYTKPKKSKREQIEGKNPPKESMVKVGACNIAVGPHLFDAMLYTVKDPNAPPPIQYTPPQRPVVIYGHPNNFQQYQSCPQPPSSQQSRQQSHFSPANSASPQPGYHQGQHLPPQSARTPNPQPPPHHPPHPPYAPQSAQRPPPSRNVQPPQPPKPSPDPVIQMLATRAASDPELKALMRVVASSKASQEQLRAFQAHIDELNAIIRAREQQQQRQQQAQAARQTPQTPHPPQQRQSQPPLSSQKPQQQHQQPNQHQVQPLSQQSSTPQSRPPSQGQQHSTPRVEIQVPKPLPSFKLNSQHPSQTPPKQPQTPAAQKSAAGTPQVKQEPGLAPTIQTPSAGAPSSSVAVVPPAPSGSAPSQPSPSPVGQLTPSQSTPSQGPAPRPGGQYPPYQGQSPAIQSRPPPHGSVAPYYRPAPPPPPARPAYKSVVFEFTSPLTPYGSSTSGHAGSGDRYLLPEYSILEWLPGGNTVLASFLLTRKVDPKTPFPIEVPSVVTTSRGKGKSAKSKKADKSKDKDKKAADKAAEPAKDQDNGQLQPKQEPAPANADSKPSTSEPAKPSNDKGDQRGQPAETPSKAKPGSEKQEDPSQTNLKEYYQPVTLRIYSANPKFLEPLGRVVKPPEEVRKYMDEIMDRAERAPDGFLAMRLPREAKEDGHESEEIKKGGTPAPAVISGARSRALRGKTVDEDSEIENVNTPIEEEEKEEEELKDFYGPPTGLPPLRV